jgi:NADPH-dependent F420 reductase
MNKALIIIYEHHNGLGRDCQEDAPGGWMRVAIVGGSGKEGFGLAVRWARAGCSVIIGSRSADKAVDAARRAAEIGNAGEIHGLPNAAAAADADVVILTIPYYGHVPILADIRSGVAGKPVVDTTVPLRQFAPPELEVPPEGSAAQQVQALLPEATVVAALHSVSSVKLNRFDDPVEGDVLLCGDDASAKVAVEELIRMLGLRALDAGALHAAGTLERLAALIVGMNQRYRRKAIGIRFTGV